MTSLQAGLGRALITSMALATLSSFAFASAEGSLERWHKGIADGYSALASHSWALDSTARSYCGQPTTELKATLEQQWRSAFGAWQAVRFVDFGPVGQNTLAWQFQFWPDPKNLVARKASQLLKAEATPDSALVAVSGVAVQGFPMVEYLLFVNRHSGKVVARFKPSHHQLSCRDLDVDDQGSVYVGYQYQGPDHELPPLIGRYRAGRYDEIRFADEVRRQLNNYIASIAVDRLSGVVAATAPKGNAAILFDSTNGAVINTVKISDCAGLKWQANRGLMISAGSGALTTLAAPKAKPVAVTKSSFRWDNHLI